MLVKTTRLRWVSAKDKNLLVLFCDTLGTRIEIKGSPQFDGKLWTLWFIPGDSSPDIQSGILGENQNGKRKTK